MDATHLLNRSKGERLAIFIHFSRAVRVIEIGTLKGYSIIWMARALLPHGIVMTIEFNEHHGDVARQNIKNAVLAERVVLHTGAALDVLPTLEAPFDMIFIDADKVNNPRYLEWAIKLSKQGTVIMGDNTVRGGGVIGSSSEDLNVKGMREFVQMISEDERLDATAIQTVGEKGWDGFVMAIVKAR
ncbi:O-methyltransferase [Pantoea sp. DY-15]|nr:O-methyltransferase [Pantoea sp. DY-15]